MPEMPREMPQDSARDVRIRSLFEMVQRFLALTGLYIVAGSEATKALEIVTRWNDPRRAILHIIAATFLIVLIVVVQYFFVMSFRLTMRRLLWNWPRRYEGLIEIVVLVLAGITQLAVALTFISGFYDLGFLGEVFTPFDALVR